MQIHTTLIQSDQNLISVGVLSFILASLSFGNENMDLIFGESALGMHWSGLGSKM
jgi:hypothetical protein